MTPMMDPVRDAEPAMATTATQRAAIRRITAELATLGATLPGTISRRTTRCGRPSCRCHAEPPQLHGPYWWWTRSVDGKTVTRILSDELYETYRTMFEGHGQARDLLAQLDHLGLAVLNADPRYGQRRGRGPTTPATAVDTPRSKRR
jgi:hypothetical protein